jgi:anaerobic selenocysteine-containing dehydrogenase
MFQAIADGRIKAVWIMGTNPVVSLPDADKVRAALLACELVVVSDCVLHTDTTACADILLPAAGWGEKDGAVTNSERRISRQRAFLPAAGEARPDWWIITQVAQRMGFGAAFAYSSPAQIFNEHARLSGFENAGQRAFDIGALSGLDESAYDALQPQQWPLDGSADARQPTDLAVARWREALARAGNEQVDVRVFAEANHFLQPQGGVAHGHGAQTTALPGEVLDVIDRWLADHVTR